MKKLWKISRILLDIWGGVCFLGAVAVVAMFTYYWTDLSEAENFADPDDLTFILNWGDIASQCEIMDVRHSYRSPRNITGDHCDVYCFTVNEFPEEFVLNEKWPDDRWRRGPVDNAILAEAIDVACGMAKGHGQAWFPATEEVDSERYYLSFVQFAANHLIVDRVRLIAYDTRQKVMYFADVAW